jgi:exodeoxyribonuclease V alpha subunit
MININLSNIPKPKTKAELIIEQINKSKQEKIEPIKIDEPREEQKEESKLIDSTVSIQLPNGEYKTVTLNAKQLEAASLIASGKSCVIVGSAGTGKTTCIQAGVQGLIMNNIIKPLKSFESNQWQHKYINYSLGGYTLVQCAFTRRVVQVIKRNTPLDLQNNVITIHKLLEYIPVIHEVEDEQGFIKKTKRFEPNRNSTNKLPAILNVIIIDESGTVSLDLHSKIIAATNENTIFIYVGDLQQLPPVFGDAILGYKMLELPVIELNEVYRQALESPILRLAHRVLSGKVIKSDELNKHWNLIDNKENGKLQIMPFIRPLKPESANSQLRLLLISMIDNNKFTVGEDIILCPFNKSPIGNIEINNIIASHLAKKANRDVYEIIGGFVKNYFSIGDYVSYGSDDAIIIDIEQNAMYTGQSYKTESKTLNYWGIDPYHAEYKNLGMLNALNPDFLEDEPNTEDDEEAGAVRQVSHKITIQYLDDGSTQSISTVSGLNNLSLNYACSIHKSQGSEWSKVFLILHNSHATMISRELLYTAITRASKQLTIICEQNTFEIGINRQKIKGQTIEEKAEWFKGKHDDRLREGKIIEYKSLLKSN